MGGPNKVRGTGRNRQINKRRWSYVYLAPESSSWGIEGNGSTWVERDMTVWRCYLETVMVIYSSVSVSVLTFFPLRGSFFNPFEVGALLSFWQEIYR